MGCARRGWGFVAERAEEKEEPADEEEEEQRQKATLKTIVVGLDQAGQREEEVSCQALFGPDCEDKGEGFGWFDRWKAWLDLMNGAEKGRVFERVHAMSKMQTDWDRCNMYCGEFVRSSQVPLTADIGSDQHSLSL